MNNFAIFFPQFHRTTVNDKAWGVGFTDWALVAVANAFQWWNKRAPAAGFYDLDQESEVSRQFEVAADIGLDGFAIYHYWFEDGPELASVERWIRGAKLPGDFRFFLIWATESWSKRWAGKEQETIKKLETRPNRASVRSHVAYLGPMLSHNACQKWRGRSMFVIYRPEFFIDPTETIGLYREEFASAGHEVSLGFFAKNPNDVSFSDLFDFCYLFEPRLFFGAKGVGRFSAVNHAYRKLLRLLPYENVEAISARLSAIRTRRSRRYFFDDFLLYMSSPQRADFVRQITCPVQNVVSCGWNNTPRYRDKFTELATPTAEQFKELLSVVRNQSLSSSELPLLCNAWNEWSEGAALEPCAYLGDQLLRCYVQNDASPTKSTDI